MRRSPSTLLRLVAVAAILSLAAAQAACAQGRKSVSKSFSKSAQMSPSAAKLNTSRFNSSASAIQKGSNSLQKNSAFPGTTKLQRSGGFSPQIKTAPALGKSSKLFKDGNLAPVIVSPGSNNWKSGGSNLHRRPNLTDAIRGAVPTDGSNLNRNRFFPGQIIPPVDLTLPAQGGNAANPQGGAAGPNIPLPDLGKIKPTFPDLIPHGPIGNPNLPRGNGNPPTNAGAGIPAPDLGPINPPIRDLNPNGPIGNPMPPGNGNPPANPGNPPANPGGGPRIPLPDLGQIEPRIPDLIPDGPIMPPGNGNPPADPGNPPADPGDPGNPPGDPGNPPGDPGNPPGDPGDPGNPPPVDPGCPDLCPWPIFWPLYPGGGYCPTPVYPAQPVIVNEAVPVEVRNDTPVVDLVLEDVQYVEPATLLVGPAYRVKFRNQSTQAAGAFRVALLAGLDGRLSEQSPKAIVDVPGLAGGQAAELTIRLPRTAMRLVGASSAQPAVFTHLFAAVDFDNAVIELDKTNNVAILERAMLEAAAR